VIQLIREEPIMSGEITEIVGRLGDAAKMCRSAGLEAIPNAIDEAATALLSLKEELEEVKERRDGGIWSLEIRDAINALEERFDISLISLDHHAGWVRRCDAFEARALAAEALLSDAREGLRPFAALVPFLDPMLEGRGNHRVSGVTGDHGWLLGGHFRLAASILERISGSALAESTGEEPDGSFAGEAQRKSEGGEIPPSDTPWKRSEDEKPVCDGWGERYLLTWCTRTATYDIGCIDGNWAAGEVIESGPAELWRWLDVNPERHLPPPGAAPGSCDARQADGGEA
jgi:hypothetical protein